jgi:hypothetical protein
MAGLESDLIGGNLPLVQVVSPDTVHLYCEGSVNCSMALFCSYLGQLYGLAQKQCILCAEKVKTGFLGPETTGTAVQFFTEFDSARRN